MGALLRVYVCERVNARVSEERRIAENVISVKNATAIVDARSTIRYALANRIYIRIQSEYNVPSKVKSTSEIKNKNS